jgi:hypothetical protein
MSTAAPIVVIVVALLVFAAGAVLARRLGYTNQAEVVARCRRGHLFTTVWASPTSRASWQRIDLGWARIQRCPVAGHWSLVVRVKDSDLTAEARRLAEQHRG